jgi:hypothetical protein
LTDVIDVNQYGEEYEPTFDPEQAKNDPLKYILLEKDGSGTIKPKFNAAQENAATSFLRTMVRNSLNQESKTDTQALPSIEWGPSSYSGGGGGGGGGDEEDKNISIYETANNTLRTGNLAALNNSDYAYQVVIDNGRRFIAVRNKSNNEKTTGKINNKIKFTKGDKGWKVLSNADDVAAYLNGVSSGREKYIQGKQNFMNQHGFALFGTYLAGDDKLTPQIYDPNLYTPEQIQRRRGGIPKGELD